MHNVLTAGVAMLAQFKAILKDFLVLVRAVVDLLACGAFKLDGVILGHRIN